MCSDQNRNKPERILLIGNSYTDGPARVFGGMVEALYPDTVVEAITPGGVTLRHHLNTESTIDKIRSGNWNIVVLQEQSQTPTLVGHEQDDFFASAREFCKLIRDAGADPAFYMTWGRRDGDRENPELNPNYETMQQKLTEAYDKAGLDNHAVVIPVGRVWSRVREQDPELGTGLYAEDGSHPSKMGQWMIASAFMKQFFDTNPKMIPNGDYATEKDAELLRACIADVMS